MYAGRIMHVKQQFVILRFHNKFINLWCVYWTLTRIIQALSYWCKNSFTLGGIVIINIRTPTKKPYTKLPAVNGYPYLVGGSPLSLSIEWLRAMTYTTTHAIHFIDWSMQRLPKRKMCRYFWKYETINFVELSFFSPLLLYTFLHPTSFQHWNARMS